MTQPFFICYGRFPDKKGDISQLEGLKAFYAWSKKDEKGEKIFYPVDIEKAGKAGLIKINSLRTDCFTVLVKGKRNFKVSKCDYLAKTSFFLFGRSPFKKRGIELALSNEITIPFDIYITPEHSYWPQIRDPVKIALLFNKNSLGKEKIMVYESGNYIEIEKDAAGDSIYIPSDDRQLRREGLTAYKQNVILAEKKQDDTIYKSSYTLLLHRSRFGNRSPLLGGSILGGTVAVVFTAVVIRRKNFKI